MATNITLPTRAYMLTPNPERLFSLTWDNSKSRRVDLDKLRKQEARGIRWSDGSISLDNGAVYENVNEMEVCLKLAGAYELRWDGE